MIDECVCDGVFENRARFAGLVSSLPCLSVRDGFREYSRNSAFFRSLSSEVLGNVLDEAFSGLDSDEFLVVNAHHGLESPITFSFEEIARIYGTVVEVVREEYFGVLRGLAPYFSGFVRSGIVSS